jgi:hypothetical protein
VARLRLQRLMRLHSPLRTARVAVPAAFVVGLRRSVAGALMPGDDAQAAYPAPSMTSPESTASVTRLLAQANEKPVMRYAICVSRRHPRVTVIHGLHASRIDGELRRGLDCMIWRFHGRLEHRDSVIYQQNSQSHEPSGCLGIRSDAAR